MIASLRGRVAGRRGSALVLEAGGVGYLVHVSAATLGAVGGVGEEAFVLVETQVREDAITLYGFASEDEREVFTLLVSVQGVGPRLALSVLSVLSPSEAVGAISAEDRRALCLASGVGPRLAARICSELKDKAAAAAAVPAGAPSAPAADGQEEARQALAGLGYSRSETERLLAAVMSGSEPPRGTAGIIRACLQAAAPAA